MQHGDQRNRNNCTKTGPNTIRTTRKTPVDNDCRFLDPAHVVPTNQEKQTAFRIPTSAYLSSHASSSKCFSSHRLFSWKAALKLSTESGNIPSVARQNEGNENIPSASSEPSQGGLPTAGAVDVASFVSILATLGVVLLTVFVRKRQQSSSYSIFSDADVDSEPEDSIPAAAEGALVGPRKQSKTGGSPHPSFRAKPSVCRKHQTLNYSRRTGIGNRADSRVGASVNYSRSTRSARGLQT